MAKRIVGRPPTPGRRRRVIPPSRIGGRSSSRDMPRRFPPRQPRVRARARTRSLAGQTCEEPEAGFEPATLRLQGECSGQLSYSGTRSSVRRRVSRYSAASPAPTAACSRFPWPFEETGTPSRGSNSPLSFRRRSSSRQHDSEEDVAPGGLGERAAVAAQRLELRACRVVAVDQHAERPETEVLRHPGGHAGEERRPGHERSRQRVDRAEHRSVGHVQPEPGSRPGGAARDKLAEQLHVVVAGSEDPLVERLLGGPHRCGRCPREGSVERSLQLHGRSVTRAVDSGNSCGWPPARYRCTTSARAAAA